MDTVKNSEGVVAGRELIIAGVQLGVQLPEGGESSRSHPHHETLVTLAIVDHSRPIREEGVL